MYKGFLVLLLPFFLSSCAWHVIDDPGRKNNGENETIISYMDVNIGESFDGVFFFEIK